MNEKIKEAVESVSLPISFMNVVTEFENELITKAMNRARWNRNRAAALLGLNRTTLVEKMKKRGLFIDKTMSSFKKVA